MISNDCYKLKEQLDELAEILAETIDKVNRLEQRLDQYVGV